MIEKFDETTQEVLKDLEKTQKQLDRKSVV